MRWITYLSNRHTQEVEIGNPLKLLEKIQREERQDVVLQKELICKIMFKIFLRHVKNSNTEQFYI